MIRQHIIQARIHAAEIIFTHFNGLTVERGVELSRALADFMLEGVQNNYREALQNITVVLEHTTWDEHSIQLRNEVLEIARDALTKEA